MPVWIDIQPVPGDPAGMRAKAAQLRGAASKLEGEATSVRNAMESMHFVGAFATGSRNRILGWQMHVAGTVSELLGLADLLSAWADKVAEQQAQQAALERRLRAQALEQMRNRSG